MFLKLLRIETEDEVLRELHFHKGDSNGII